VIKVEERKERWKKEKTDEGRAKWRVMWRAR
jgi:hypothetical protein